ncbi:MAG TPA: hypothetical protein VFT98_15350, partial [Myxococcota bacterium]|nr:hypothetical protein [Myxococcota bacterium]
CMMKRQDAVRSGMLRARIQAIDDELTDVVEAIQYLCSQMQLALPQGVPPMRPWPETGAALVERTLALYVRLLQARERALAAAIRDADRPLEDLLRSSIDVHRETIRKLCEAVNRPLPPSMSELQ